MRFGEGKDFVRRLDFVIDCEHGDFAIGGALPGLEYTNVFGLSWLSVASVMRFFQSVGSTQGSMRSQPPGWR